MLLIPCPWCGPRDDVEFRYGGQALLSYPADPDALSDEEWADYLFMRDNPKGDFSERWFHTGDMAVVDEEGYYLIVDRKKDIIISGGENISSIEVEKAIFSNA